MTKKDFELIAGVLLKARKYKARTPEQQKAIICMLDVIGYDFANILKETNHLFDDTRFLKACGTDIYAPGVPCKQCNGIRDVEALICNSCSIKLDACWCGSRKVHTHE